MDDGLEGPRWRAAGTRWCWARAPRGSWTRSGGAKRQVAGWLAEWFGWKDVVDLGDITTPRGAGMLLPLWMRLWGALGTPMFNFKVVR